MADRTDLDPAPPARRGATAAAPPPEREFVRNRIGGEAGLAGFTGPGAAGPGAGTERVTAWVWNPVPQPALASLAPRGRAWERTRYRAYQAHLAGHRVGETFGRAAGFVQLAADAAQVTDGRKAWLVGGGDDPPVPDRRAVGAAGAVAGHQRPARAGSGTFARPGGDRPADGPALG